ncbi:radical SAM protein [Roseovarius sp.]|uniref:radical SAM protein n=1 Tax=Roseovarius sp. TaxID=1486281 RepID=UPI003D0A25FC
MKRPHLIMPDDQAVAELVHHPAFRAHQTPLQIFNRATDPLLPRVKEHLHRCLELLDDLGLTNHILVITRWHVLEEDVARFERLKNLKVTILITWSGIFDPRIEPIDSSIAHASLSTLASCASRTRKILYWRPIVLGLNDTDELIAEAYSMSQLADATVFTGLFHREKIRDYLRSVNVPDLYKLVPRRKILPREVEGRILEAFGGTPIFRKTSCGVAYAHGVHDYNGHFGIKHICDICPAEQVKICAAAHKVPTQRQVLGFAREVGLEIGKIDIFSGHIVVENSTEQQRYFIQHATGFQVHDRAHPHLPGRHGRSDEGWTQ